MNPNKLEGSGWKLDGQTAPNHGPTHEGQPFAARDHQRKPARIFQKKVRSAQRSAQQRQQKRKDSR